ncbi:MAG TPA: isoleucine--tRNA ligase [Candidatus Paceibacterota bacterium]|nr:isoleucine--tRNA ligase [Candidatus Paceibacterota bacterium]
MADTNDTPKSEVAKREEAILAFWRERDIFKKSVDKEPTKGEYVFYDGPPFATGLPHYGHIVASVIKDVVPRYFTMRGYRVPRIWGWDCHGLPIENIVEKELGFKHKKDIKEYGIAKFNERCREQVLTYAHEWEKIIPRIGRFVDMEHAYRTMDKSFMESVWWVFKQLFDKGLVYEDYRVMHICPRCETTLSQQEVSEGYKDVKDISVTAKFKLKKNESIKSDVDVYILAWTTTPWTLPGNVALAVGGNIDYVRAKHKDGSHEIIIAEAAYDRETFPLKHDDLGVTPHYKDSLYQEYEKVGIVFPGHILAGLEYEALFDYYAKDTTLKNRENGWKVYAADFVTTESGTGVVHIAPAFGSDDWELLKKENLPFVQHVNYDGTMKPEVTDFAGMEVKPRSDDDRVRLGTDIAVLKYLQDNGSFFSKENITHAYPHCWRCDTPLLNYATSSWFVNVTKIKDNLLENAKAINWSPSHIKEGRWGKWLEGARDWSVSRQRFWASVIPIWVCEKCKKQRVFGSVSELEEASGKKVDDLHKHIVDEITLPCECGGVMKRIPDVLDTWFDSGSMPYGERHYPFENKEKFDAVFPAQFIAEGIDQTRAWFYYLHVLASGIFQKNAFQNVIVNGIVLAEDGKKMSKKLKNYPDPMEVVDTYGADALRFYLLSSPVMQAENLGFSEKGVDDIVKKNIGRLNNVLAFYELYKDGTPRDWKSTNVLDRWILSRLDELVAESTKGFESYQLDVAARPISGFIDDLSVWYLRRSRDRFKTNGTDKEKALATLRYVLHTLSRVMAPTMPFFAEYLFQAVREEEDEESVHLAMWPEIKPRLNLFFRWIYGTRHNMDLLPMKQTRLAVEHILMVRDIRKIRVRQPLSEVALNADFLLSPELIEIIKQETNVEQVSSYKDINVIHNLKNNPDWHVIDDVGTLQLAINIKITPELEEKGLVRDFLRTVQGERKNAGLNPHDTITLKIDAPEEARLIINKYKEEIANTLKAAVVSFGEVSADKKIVGKYSIGIEVTRE